MAAYNAAMRAENDHDMACLRHTTPAAALTLIKTLHDPTAGPATRLDAVVLILGHAQDAMDMDDFAADVAAVERAAAAGKSPMAGGHGAKYPRTWRRAIAALLTSRTVADAARAVGLSPQTLRRWMAEPEFIAQYSAAAGAAFGPTMEAIKRAVKPATCLVHNFSVDMKIPAATRRKAENLRIALVKAEQMKNLEARVAAAEPVNAIAENGESRKTSKIIGKKLHERVQRLKALLSPVNWPAKLQMIFGHAEEGRPAGTSMIGTDGRHVWRQAPNGCRDGEPVSAPRAA
jgi:hypothetical protein